MGVSNCSTVPRKRRPRAIGEVFISSQSAVYLTDPSAPKHRERIVEESEPLYQNTESVTATKSSPTEQLFNSCRISEQQDIDESSTEPQTETQRVSVFIGENIHFC